MSKNSSLSEEVRAVILGSLLGDGSLRLHKKYQNARFFIRHSSKQKEYFLWKVSLLREISGEKCWIEQSPDGWSNNTKLLYQSKALPEITELYKLTHSGQNLRVRRKWLNLMTPLSLAIMWMDDGSIIGNGRRGVICTDRIPYDEQLIICKYLSKVWGVKARVGMKSRGSAACRIWIRSAESLKRLLRIILPYVKVESMLPKVLLIYRDAHAQKRWASEVASATGFPEETVWRYIEEKKLRWRSQMKI